MKKHVSVAIDGPSGAGKSTIARVLAQELGYIYVDTGAIYRTVGYYMNLMGIGPRDVDGVTRLLDEVNIELRYEDGVQHMILNGSDVTGEIRTPEMSLYASAVSAMPVVRDFLMETQRKLARENDVIMDGRDIGTVVLPNADVKIFLTASAEERARRRYKELLEKGEKVTYEKVLADMRQRDRQDTERACAPLRCAEDAVRVDTSNNTFAESITLLRSIIEERRK